MDSEKLLSDTNLVQLEVELPRATLEAIAEYQKRYPHLTLNHIAQLGISMVVYSHPHA